MRMLGAVLLGAVIAGCASAGDPVARDLPRTPRTWTPEEREAPRRDPAPPPRRGPGGYPEEAAAAPLYVVPAGRWAAVGPGAVEERRLAGRGPAFMRGVETLAAPLPVREAVWAHDARPVAAGADSVVFATPWVPVARLGGELRCDPGPRRTAVRARLVGRFRVADADLLVEGWMETEDVACMGGSEARDRVRAFADDLDRFAREAARRAEPVPLPEG